MPPALFPALALLVVSVQAFASPPRMSVRVQDGRFVDATGATVQLRGVNYSGFEFAAIQGWSGDDPSGGQAGQAGGPKWSALQSWKVNTLRLPLNEASWLGLSCTDTGGQVRKADPAGNYREAVRGQVTQANAAGLYVILDLHWTAPGKSCPMLQTQMANADHSLAFWSSVASTFRDNPAVLFELFNEPFMNFGFEGDAWSHMMKGSGGAFTSYPATGGGGQWMEVKKPWAVASYQQMIDAVRAAGAGNVVLVGTMQYSQDLGGWLEHRPRDPLAQMAAAWHPYPTFGAAWGTAARAQPNFGPAVFDQAAAIVDAGIPVVITETGDRNARGTKGSPLVLALARWADRHGAGMIGFTWNVWAEPENVLIRDVDGTPTDGYGEVFRSWMLAH